MAKSIDRSVLSAAHRRFCAEVLPHRREILSCLVTMHEIIVDCAEETIVHCYPVLRASLPGAKMRPSLGEHLKSTSPPTIGMILDLPTVEGSIALGVDWCDASAELPRLYVDFKTGSIEKAEGLIPLLRKYGPELRVRIEDTVVYATQPLEAEEFRDLPEKMTALLMRWIEALAAMWKDHETQRDLVLEEMNLI